MIWCSLISKTHLFSCGHLVELSSSCWNINLFVLLSLKILPFFQTTLSSPLMSSKLICSYLLDFFIFWTTLLNTDGSSARSSWKKENDEWMNRIFAGPYSEENFVLCQVFNNLSMFFWRILFFCHFCGYFNPFEILAGKSWIHLSLFLQMNNTLVIQNIKKRTKNVSPKVCAI